MDDSPYSPELAALLEQTLVVALAKQARLQRLLGDEDHGWSLDLSENRLELAPGAVYEVDVLGTESTTNGTFLWAWSNPSFSERQRTSAVMLRKVGRERRIRELVADGEVPVARMEASLACLLGMGAVDADAYFVGEHDEGSVAVLLHDEALRAEPFHVLDLAFAMNRVVMAPVSHRRAVEAFATGPPKEFAADVGESTIVFTHADGTVEIDFDELGRATDLRVEARPSDEAVGAPPIPIAYEPSPAPPPEHADPGDTRTLGEIAFPGGPIVVADPLLLLAGVPVQPLPGGMPAGEHDVDVALVDDPAGGQRVELAYVFVSDEEVVEWQEGPTVLTDSGLLAFGSPDAARLLADRGDGGLAELEAALAGNATDTWSYAQLGDVLMVAVGFGAGGYDISWGYDRDEELVCLAVECLDPDELRHVAGEPPSVSGSPGRGLQRATLAPLGAAGWDPRNVAILPPVTARRLAHAVARRIIAGAGEAVELDVTLEHDDDEDQVPARVVIDAGVAGREVIEVDRTP